MKYGDIVRMTEAFKGKVTTEGSELQRIGNQAHIKEFGNCIGVVEGKMFPDSDAPELDVRWHPSNLRYGYFPQNLELAVPASYHEDFIKEPLSVFIALRDGLAWEKRGNVPRHEYYCNDFALPYIYGRGRGRRQYERQPYHPLILEIRKSLEELVGTTFEVCFLNRYLTQSDQLGWHADDSPEMDDRRPIAVVSLGAPREIWFRKMTSDDPFLGKEWSKPSRLLLGNGSLLLMNPWMQDTHQHRIPKASHKCEERISLTFRGYVREQ